MCVTPPVRYFHPQTLARGPRKPVSPVPGVGLRGGGGTRAYGLTGTARLTVDGPAIGQKHEPPVTFSRNITSCCKASSYRSLTPQWSCTLCATQWRRGTGEGKGTLVVDVLNRMSGMQ